MPSPAPTSALLIVVPFGQPGDVRPFERDSTAYLVQELGKAGYAVKTIDPVDHVEAVAGAGDLCTANAASALLVGSFVHDETNRKTAHGFFRGLISSTVSSAVNNAVSNAVDNSVAGTMSNSAAGAISGIPEEYAIGELLTFASVKTLGDGKDVDARLHLDLALVGCSGKILWKTQVYGDHKAGNPSIAVTAAYHDAVSTALKQLRAYTQRSPAP